MTGDVRGFVASDSSVQGWTLVLCRKRTFSVDTAAHTHPSYSPGTGILCTHPWSCCSPDGTRQPDRLCPGRAARGCGCLLAPLRSSPCSRYRSWGYFRHPAPPLWRPPQVPSKSRTPHLNPILTPKSKPSPPNPRQPIQSGLFELSV